MFVQRNKQARLFNRCCRGTEMSITQAVCVFVALDIQNTRRTPHIVINGLLRSTIFFHRISQTAKFLKKKTLNIQQELRVPVQRLSEIVFILRRNEQDMIKSISNLL